MCIRDSGYDGAGRRVKVSDSSGTRYFLYDGGMPVLELDQHKNITHIYLTGADGVVYRRKHQTGTAHKPVARWHFDEGSGTVAEDTEGSNDGTLGAGDADKVPQWNADGGLTFDGVNDTVKVPDSDALDLAGDTLTVSLYVKRQPWLTALLVKKSDAANGYRVSLTPIGTVQFNLRQGGVSKTVHSTTTVPVNKWTHIAARYNGAALRVFINGTIETTKTAMTGDLVATTEPLWIGGGSTTFFKGVIDDLSIYDSALSNADIAYLANNPPNFEYHHVNGLGSPIVLTDDDQKVRARYAYDVFGAIRSETGTSDNPRKFTGKEWDTDSNLYYFAARYYDPYIGRFTQRDPIGDGVNYYAYTYNNPLKFVDPTGLRPPNLEEQAALKSTFGPIVASYLTKNIEIVIMEGWTKWFGRVPTGSYHLVELYRNYNSSYLADLAIFIHEATHIWQKHTGRYREDAGGDDYEYTAMQLRTRNLKAEEHARAVKDWFRATYRSPDIFSTPTERTDYLYTAVEHSTELEPHEISPLTPEQKLWMIGVNYKPLLDEIRNPLWIIARQLRLVGSFHP